MSPPLLTAAERAAPTSRARRAGRGVAGAQNPMRSGKRPHVRAVFTRGATDGAATSTGAARFTPVARPVPGDADELREALLAATMRSRVAITTVSTGSS